MKTPPASRRTRTRARTVVFALLVALAVLGAAVYALGASSRRSYTITGSVSAGPLRPGVSVPLNVTLRNPHESGLRVAQLDVSIDGLAAPMADAAHPCTAADFAVAAFSGDEVELPASSTRSLSSLGIPESEWPQVLMADRAANQDGCRNAVLTLRFTGVSRSRGV